MLWTSVSAAVANMSVNWGVVAPVATAVAAVMALVLREFQRRREDLNLKVSNAVSAGLGRTLLEFRQLEEGAKETLNTVVANAKQIEQQLRERLDVSERQSDRLTELLSDAAAIVPQLADTKAAVPALLISQADSAEPEAAMGYLIALLNSDLASSDLLTAGGNIAARRLGTPTLALSLYDKAVALNPNNADAAASAIRIRTTGGELSASDGVAQITAVVERNPLDRNAISEALNLFMYLEDAAGMLEFVDRQLESSSPGIEALLWRNRGIALADLRRPREEVIAAYQRSFDLGIEAGDESEISNTARPFARFLRRVGMRDKARSIVQTALKGDPRSAQLLCQLGDFEMNDQRFDAAAWCYELAARCAEGPTEAMLAQRSLIDLNARRDLAEHGFLQLDPDVPGGDSARPADGTA